MPVIKRLMSIADSCHGFGVGWSGGGCGGVGQQPISKATSQLEKHARPLHNSQLVLAFGEGTANSERETTLGKESERVLSLVPKSPKPSSAGFTILGPAGEQLKPVRAKK